MGLSLELVLLSGLTHLSVDFAVIPGGTAPPKTTGGLRPNPLPVKLEQELAATAPIPKSAALQAHHSHMIRASLLQHEDACPVLPQLEASVDYPHSLHPKVKV